MPRPGGMAIVAAGAVLLAAGCDYWRNLTHEVTPDRATVALHVRDALTGEALADASCGKAGQRLYRADGDGVVRRDDMPTGNYDLVCEAPFYRARTTPFELRLGETKRDTQWLVREGGDRWYPGIHDREVRIQPLAGNGRYPGPLVVRAFPEDSSGRFHYQWSSNLHAVPPMSPKPVCTLYTAASRLDSQDLDLGLKVFFKPRSDAHMYLVDSAFLPMKLSRNLPPEIHLPTQFMSKKVGCPEDDAFRVIYHAFDPDSSIGCEVRVTSMDPHAPAGIINTVVPCGHDVFTFKVEPHPGSPTVAVRRNSYVKLEVRDGNGETQSRTFTAESVSNLPPSVDVDLLHSSQTIFTTTPVLCSLTVDDAEGGKLDSVVLDWGDGTRLHISMGFTDIPYSKLFYQKKYGEAGNYLIKASVYDRCNGIGRNQRLINVRKNSRPVFRTVRPDGVDPRTGEFRLHVEVQDEDINLDLDTINLFIQWNLDRDPAEDTVIIGQPNRAIDQIVSHLYRATGAETDFTIKLQAFDQHGDRTDTTIVIPKLQAILVPPPSPTSQARPPPDP